MTLMKVSNLIYETFLSAPVINADMVIKENTLISDLPCPLNRLITMGFEELEKANICKNIPETDYYVLIEDLNKVSQNLEVKADIGVFLVKELNRFLQNVGKPPTVEVGAIKDVDLGNIVLALKVLNEEIEKRKDD